MNKEIEEILTNDEYQKTGKAKYICKMDNIGFGFGNKENAIKFCDKVFQYYGIKPELKSLVDYDWDKNPEQLKQMRANEARDNYKFDKTNYVMELNEHMTTFCDIADQLCELKMHDTPLDNISINQIQHVLTTRKNVIESLSYSEIFKDVDKETKKICLNLTDHVLSIISLLTNGLNNIKIEKGIK